MTKYSVFSEIDSEMSLPRSDPTENDSVEGLRPNARGPGLVTFGVSVHYPLLRVTRTLHEILNGYFPLSVCT